MSTDAVIIEALGLDLEFNETKECERPDHNNTSTVFHGGPGRWYMILECPNCKYNKGGDGVILICDIYKNICVTDYRPVQCKECGFFGKNKDFFRVVGEVK